jgi:hypothetical protein
MVVRMVGRQACVVLVLQRDAAFPLEAAGGRSRLTAASTVHVIADRSAVVASSSLIDSPPMARPDSEESS